jgi:hypothetical protein
MIIVNEKPSDCRQLTASHANPNKILETSQKNKIVKNFFVVCDVWFVLQSEVFITKIAYPLATKTTNGHLS